LLIENQEKNNWANTDDDAVALEPVNFLT